MFFIEQSSILNALGFAISNSLWQIAIIWLFYIGITGIIKLSASRKYQLATALSMLGFVWFISTFIYSFLNTPLKTISLSAYSLANNVENISNFSIINHLSYIYHFVLASLKNLSPYISCAYLFIFLLLSFRLINGFRQVNFFATQGLNKIDSQWNSFVHDSAKILKIKQSVSIFTSCYVQSPLTVGFWKPIILLPIASMNNLSTQQVEAILLHELAHIRRYDYLVNIFVQVIEISLFFNPFMHLLIKQIKQERENSCDDYVLQFQYSAKDYANALLTIEKNNAAPILSLGINNHQSFQLLNRIKRMVAPQSQTFGYWRQSYVLLIFILFLFAFTILVPTLKLKMYTAQISSIKSNRIITSLELPAHSRVATIPLLAFSSNISLTEKIKPSNNITEKTYIKNTKEVDKAYKTDIYKYVQPPVAQTTLDRENLPLDHLPIITGTHPLIEDNNLNEHIKELIAFNDTYTPPLPHKLHEILKFLPPPPLPPDLPSMKGPLPSTEIDIQPPVEIKKNLGIQKMLKARIQKVLAAEQNKMIRIKIKNNINITYVHKVQSDGITRERQAKQIHNESYSALIKEKNTKEWTIIKNNEEEDFFKIEIKTNSASFPTHQIIINR